MRLRGGATPYTCYAVMLVSLWHAKCCLFFKASVLIINKFFKSQKCKGGGARIIQGGEGGE